MSRVYDVDCVPCDEFTVDDCVISFLAAAGTVHSRRSSGASFHVFSDNRLSHYWRISYLYGAILLPSKERKRESAVKMQ